MLGMMQQELWVRLGEDDRAIVWRTVNSSSTDSGTIDINDIHKCARSPCLLASACRPTDLVLRLQMVSAERKRTESWG